MADGRREISPHVVYTIKEVAEILQVGNATMRRWLKEGKVRSSRVGRGHRFLGAHLLEMLEASEAQPEASAPMRRPRGHPPTG